MGKAFKAKVISNNIKHTNINALNNKENVKMGLMITNDVMLQNNQIVECGDYELFDTLKEALFNNYLNNIH